MIFRKKERLKLIQTLEELVELLRTITNRVVKTHSGVELHDELMRRLDEIDKRLGELKK